MADAPKAGFVQHGCASVIIRLRQRNKGLRLKAPTPPLLQGQRVRLRGFARNDRLTVTSAGKAFVRNICMAFDLRMKRNVPETQLFSMTV